MLHVFGFDWIVAIPNSGVVVSCCWDHDGSHDGGNVECWPFAHEVMHQSCLIEIAVSSCFDFLLNWDSSGIMEWIGLVSIVVCLDEEPLIIAELIPSVDAVGISFNDCSLIGSNS